MRSGAARLAIDCGSATTTAVVAWPDGRWFPLQFDGGPALSSAVFLSDDGNVLTGQRAWQAAAADPGRFIPAPRRSAEQVLTVAGTEVDALDLVVATPRRVAAEAQQAVGVAVEDVRVVVPAGWGPRRRTWMRHAAHRAGLPQPRLVEAPVAVAGQLLTEGVQLPVGSSSSSATSAPPRRSAFCGAARQDSRSWQPSPTRTPAAAPLTTR